MYVCIYFFTLAKSTIQQNLQTAQLGSRGCRPPSQCCHSVLPEKNNSLIFTQCSDKNTHLILAHNFGKCWPIFKILTHSDSAVIL